MKNITISSLSYTFILAVLGILLFPSLSFGYFTTSQSAVALTKDTALYTITYKFGSKKDDFYMPISVVRDLAQGSQTKSGGTNYFAKARMQPLKVLLWG